MYTKHKYFREGTQKFKLFVANLVFYVFSRVKKFNVLNFNKILISTNASKDFF